MELGRILWRPDPNHPVDIPVGRVISVTASIPIPPGIRMIQGLPGPLLPGTWSPPK